MTPRAFQTLTTKDIQGGFLILPETNSRYDFQDCVLQISDIFYNFPQHECRNPVGYTMIHRQNLNTI